MAEHSPTLWGVDGSAVVMPDGHRMQRDDFDIRDEDWDALVATVRAARTCAGTEACPCWQAGYEEGLDDERC